MTERWRTELGKIDRLAPDDDVVERARRRPRPPDPGPSHGARIATILVALALPIAGISAAYVAFRGGDSPTSTPGNGAAPSTENGALLYAKNVNQGWSLFVLDPDTGVERQITEGFRDYGSDWSPDGRSIVYDSESREGGQGIWIENVDGTNPRHLIDNGSVPAWSPDWNRIVFARHDLDEIVSLGKGVRGTPSHLYVMDVDGTHVQRLTDGPFSDYSPAWSPDGTQIAFLRTGREGSGLFVMNVDSSDVRQVADGLEIFGAPDWSPDGSSIAVAVNGTKGGAPGGIMLLPPDGGTRGRMVPGTEVRNPDHVSNPAWSPDGEWIAYVHGYPGEIVVMHPDGSAPRTLNVDPGHDSIEELAWGVRPSDAEALPSRPVAGPSASPSPTADAEFELTRGTYEGNSWRLLLYASQHGWCLGEETRSGKGGACGFGVPPRDLGVSVSAGVDYPTFVMGAVSRRVHSVQIRLKTGEIIQAELFDPPSDADVEFRIFFAALDERVLLRSNIAGRVEAKDGEGKVVATDSLPPRAPPPGHQETPS